LFCFFFYFFLQGFASSSSCNDLLIVWPITQLLLFVATSALMVAKAQTSNKDYGQWWQHVCHFLVTAYDAWGDLCV
jgi:ABC-type polysaccharide/polyol phosphate export permease